MTEQNRAGELLPVLQACLRAELTAEGAHHDATCEPGDESLVDSDAIPETGYGGTQRVLGDGLQHGRRSSSGPSVRRRSACEVVNKRVETCSAARQDF